MSFAFRFKKITNERFRFFELKIFKPGQSKIL